MKSLFDASAPAFSAHIQAANKYKDHLMQIGRTPPPAPRFDQDWFPTLDAVAAYTMVREGRPKRILEVGSGHSTRFYAQAVADAELNCQITAIDPAPRAVIEGLPINFCRMTLQDAYLSGAVAELLGVLQPGDVVSIDSSHILMPGSDVDLFLGRMLPDLPSGAIVHIHDIFLPDAYPSGWHWRGYNEQNAVYPLIASTDFELLFASHYFATYQSETLKASFVSRLPSKATGLPASLWLRKK